MKKINYELIQSASDILNNSGLVHDNMVASELNGYVSSFGAAAVQSGLIPAIYFYAQDEDPDSKRKKILAVLAKLVDNEASKFNSSETDFDKIIQQLAILQKHDLYRVKQKWMMAVTVLKLVLRTYKQTD